MTFKLLICALNSKYIHSSLAPWCLLAGMQKYGNTAINTEIYEGTVNMKIENVVYDILKTEYDIIAFSVYIWNIEYIKKLLPLLKQNQPKLKIILGGPEVSFNSKQVLNEILEVDYILCGEGEESFPALINSLYENDVKTDIKGLSMRGENEIIQNGVAQNENPPPSPYTQEYFKALNSRISYIETSRGCPFSCAFCLSGRCGKLRFIPLERAKKEILLLSKSGTKTVKFVDRTFNANPKRALEIVNFIKGLDDIPKDLCYHFEIAGDILSDDLIMAFNTAQKGRFQLEIGLQSFNEETLIAVNRKTDTKRLISNIEKLLAPQNIHIHIDLIAGLPKEDKESFYKGLNLAYALNPHMLQMGFLKILHGSPMGEDRGTFKSVHESTAPYMIRSTPWLDEKDLEELMKVEDALDRLYNSGRFKRTLIFLTNTLNLKLSELLLLCKELVNGERISLDEYSDRLYNFFSKRLDKMELRDVMILDRLSVNASGKIPQCLRIEDINLKKAKRQAMEFKPIKKGVKRAVALLYSKKKIVFVDYEDKDPVSSQYKINYLDYTVF